MKAKTSRSWKILLASEDRGLLRSLSRFLRVFGYEVDEAADSPQALAAWEARRPDFLVIDGSQAFQRSLQPCMSTCILGETSKVYTFLLAESDGECDAAAAVESGIDDFLKKPFDYGELLARLQTGARCLEFERRMRAAATAHSPTGCLTRSALLRRIRAALAEPDAAERSRACVLLDLDFFCRVNHVHGFEAGDALLRSVAQRLRDRCTAGEPLACFGADRFAVFLADASESDAAAWAEQVRSELAQGEFRWEHSIVRITASFGVAAARGASVSPEELIEMAGEALRYAKSSGRDCVARYREFDDESRAWTDLAAPGKLFERTTARDLMIPCPATLSAYDSLRSAVALFRRTQLTALPVIDAGGRLKGLLLEETVFDDLDEHRRQTATVREAMIADPPWFDENERFAALLEFFTRQDYAAAAVTAAGRPTGVVTRQSLATLTTPINSDSFLPEELELEGVGRLVIPELCPTAASALE